MTSPRGPRAAGRPGGGDASARPPGGAEPAETVKPETVTAETAGTTTMEAPARTPDLADQAQVSDQPQYQAGPIWAHWLPPAVAFLLCLWGITGPSFWRDEAATIAAVKR